jgi:hypothetical protein
VPFPFWEMRRSSTTSSLSIEGEDFSTVPLISVDGHASLSQLARASGVLTAGIHLHANTVPELCRSGKHMVRQGLLTLTGEGIRVIHWELQNKNYRPAALGRTSRWLRAYANATRKAHRHQPVRPTAACR